MLVRLLILAMIARLVAGCGGAPKPAATAKKGSTYLASIAVKGNRAVPPDDLLDGLALKKAKSTGHPVDPYLLELDTRRIRGAYLRLGFFDVKVTSTVENPTGEQRVIFQVVEGPRSTTSIDRNSFPGLPAEVRLEDALALVELRDGDPFDYEKFDDAKTKLLLLVQDAGYPHVAMDASVVADRERRRANVRYAFEPGIRARFGDVTIRGVDAFPDLRRAIANRIAWDSHGWYAASAVARTQQQLYELGRFSTVNVEPEKTDRLASSIPVKITVRLTPRHEAKVGGGVGADTATYEGRVRGSALLIPEWFPLWTLAADGRVAVQKLRNPTDGQDDSAIFRTRALFSATRADMFLPFLRGDFAVGYELNAVEAYTASGPIARVGASYPLTRRVTVRAGWTFNYFSFSNLSDALDDAARTELGFRRNNGFERNGAFQQALIADLRDNRLAPRRGLYFDLRVSEGTRLAGSALTYLQINPDFRVYYPLTETIVLAGRLRGGTILGQVPITERYFSGGAQNHRGFSERQLSPSRSRIVDVPDPDPAKPPKPTLFTVTVGGAAVLETGLELRIPVGALFGGELGLTLFVDAGDVTQRLSDLDPFHLHVATGLGLSYKVAGIKIRLDFAQRLNRKELGEPEIPITEDPNDRSRFRFTLFHLGIGETF
ncbi:MAG: BamA/TamA family outer membrane protein [Deltaproteobacteria bacterium]|nr:BamA/TamA family outer membrane protein [Deltaproteobacteria bacterium]MCW5806548.1 BamA/TamA family outer membrane protein [Deltaproteobacteria bacterium]